MAAACMARLMAYVGAAMPATTQAWSFVDDSGTTFQGQGSTPKIVCHVDVCESLWSMGVGADQLVGYFGHSGDTMYAMTDLCHGNLCMQAHFEQMESVDGSGSYAIDVSKVQSLNPDMIIDYAYRPVSDTYNGLLGYSPQWNDLQATGINIIHVLVAHKGYVEVLETMERLATAAGAGPNPDVAEHCSKLRQAMNAMTQTARTMWASGVRVLAASITSSMIYAADPTDDPILIMLEEVGVPMTHINVTDPRGHYWEYITFPANDRNTANIARLGGHPMYPVDVWLYDSRSTRYHEEDINITDPAWAVGQYTHWPIDSAFTYERAARILNTLRPVFARAQRVAASSVCTLADVSQRQNLQPGQWACHDPKPDYASCPTAPESAVANAEAEDEGVGVGAAIGIGLGCAGLGMLLGGGCVAMLMMKKAGGAGGGLPASTYGKSEI